MSNNTKKMILLFLSTFISQAVLGKDVLNYISLENNFWLTYGVLFLFVLPLGILAIYNYLKFAEAMENNKKSKYTNMDSVLQNIESSQIKTFLKMKQKSCCGDCKKTGTPCTKFSNLFLALFLVLGVNVATAQTTADRPLANEPGIIITVVLLMLPILLAAVLIINRATNSVKRMGNERRKKEAETLAEEIKRIDNHELEDELEGRRNALDFSLQNNELAGNGEHADPRGIISNVSDKHEVHFTALKKKAAPRPSLEPNITKLIVWFLGCAAFWLVVGTLIGEYVGIKFIAPDADHVSWLSFGRLRPVHTNIVFWGWASMGLIGLGHYVVPTVSNAKLFSIKIGWIALILLNLQVIIGSISLMAGINNGGGEFREFIWPIQALLAGSLILTLYNFLRTVANRTTKEIYISNWYVLSSYIFTIVVAVTAYLPFWQNGLGETIIQGYFMHSGVGMWFTLSTLGLLYYFIPQQINKPIYAYSLGILAFWTQILFYTIIGTHHFTFSAVPWWLQTVGIVGSAGMIIPVVAATINYFMTFKGQWDKVSNSYTLPFFLTAVVYYLVVSLQGTAEAFRYTNLLWHFTDFTVGHSHLGFYGIITFAIWGGTYAIVPRLTGKEPPQHLVGAHFWIAFVGLLLYAIPLMIGGTFKGMMWMDGKPFIDSVVMMFEYWIWRAIGGSLMVVSHLIYLYNFYKMTNKELQEVDVKTEAFKILEKELQTN